MDDPEVDLVADVDLEQRVLERLDGTGDIALEDEVEHVDLALGECLGEVLEADPLAATGLGGVALDGIALLGDLPGGAVVIGGDERITGARHRGQTEHLDGTRGSRLGDGIAVLVEHRTDATEGRAADDRIALAQGAGLDEDGRDGAAALVELGFDRDAAGGLVRVRPQVESGVRGQQHRLEELVDALALERGDRDEHRVAAVLLGHEVVLGELLHDLGRVRTLLVDLVDRHDDRHIRGLRVVERFDRLRHHAVVGGDHEDREVRRLRTTGTHGGERLVTRGVEERDAALGALVLDLDLVGADVLGDAAGLAGDDVGRPDRVEQLRLAVVDVTHDGDDRGPGDEIVVVLLGGFGIEVDVEGLEQLAVLVLGRDDLDLVAELLTEDLEGVLVE